MKPEWHANPAVASEAADPDVASAPRRLTRVVPRSLLGGTANGERPLEGDEPARSPEVALRLLVEHVPVVLWATDRDLRVTWRLKHASLSGLDARLSQLLGSGDPEAVAVGAHRRALKGEAVEFDQGWEERTFRARVEPLRSPDGEVVGTVAIAVELGEEARREREELFRAGLYDALTHLPNRALFLERLRRATAGADWCREGLFVLVLDVDGFHDINARLGFEAGDRLLSAAAGRLARRLRPGDTLARYGPDKFAVLLAGLHSGDEAVQVAQRLLGEMRARFDLQGAAVTASASVGIAGGAVGQRAEDILRDAERALARAKVMGRSSCQVFMAGKDAQETVLGNIETALRRALDLEEFRSRYRPTINRKEGKVAGFEVVLWKRLVESGEAKPSAKPAAKPSARIAS